MTEYIKPKNPFILKTTRDFETSSERVFDAWLDADHIAEWLFATPDGDIKEAEMDGKVGGGFIVSEQRGDELARHIGTFLEIDRPNKIVFSFIYEAAETSLPTLVTVDLIATESGCTLNLYHEMDNIYSEYEQSAKEGWNTILQNFSKIVYE
ncbi:MAG: SRPBCC domain-containing protein [Kordiimonadaceae bacterium]|jgi:uncharacterized protein YndB with AHSA1/START domain|nr:SRPBCC domain-containing protein [Kordiimonadaceae bacterium]MBT6033594.1 SRPBCC domain-containing protein [Kordiimonadaceae bacterium]